MDSTPSFSRHTTHFIRTVALSCITGSLIAVVGSVIPALLPSAVPLTNVSKPYTPVTAARTDAPIVFHLPILMLLSEFFRWPIANWSAWFVLLGIALYQNSRMTATGTGMAGDCGLDGRMTALSEGM